MNKYTVTVLGLGFVGLTTALAFAEKGYLVYGFDINEERKETIRAGKLPFKEPGLDQALLRHHPHRFQITDDVVASVRESDFVFLCVGTPSGEGGEVDLKHIFSAIQMFAPVLHDGKHRTVVVKSTIPPSTTSERIIPFMNELGLSPGDQFSIANNPEFLREGKCWDDMMNADRIICGIYDAKGEEMLRSLYSVFDSPFYAVSLNTAEFIKYLSNTLLSTMISYANEMSKIADLIGDIQIKEAFQILHLDRRWKEGSMASYVFPGCGYGGYCLPKDTQAMYACAVSKGYEPMILKYNIEINESMPQYMVDKIIRQTDPSDKIGILGLSFKPNSDDVRDSTSAKIISRLVEAGYKHIHAYDPWANEAFSKAYPWLEIVYFDHLQDMCESSDVLVLVTAWEQFAGIDRKFPDKRIVDCRYFL